MTAPNELGNRHGPWTVIARSSRPAGFTTPGQYWLCQCVCGRSTSVISGARLRAGRYRRGCDICAGRQYGQLKANPTYQSWRAMRERCLRPDSHAWKYYGGRGIKICDRWVNSFQNFLDDMGERPRGLTLDRIDCNGNYEPSNCRWADHKTQARNSRHFKLTDDQIEAIRNILKCGARQVDVATAVGVARGHIANIEREFARRTPDQKLREAIGVMA